MIEPLRSAEGAGRYVSAEASKPHQKRLPKWYDGGLGRWWGMNKAWKPRCRALVDIDLADWPFPTPLRHIWDGQTIADCIRDIRSYAAQHGSIEDSSEDDAFAA